MTFNGLLGALGALDESIAGRCSCYGCIDIANRLGVFAGADHDFEAFFDTLALANVGIPGKIVDVAVPKSALMHIDAVVKGNLLDLGEDFNKTAGTGFLFRRQTWRADGNLVGVAGIVAADSFRGESETVYFRN